MQLQPITKLGPQLQRPNPLVAASQSCTPVDVAQPVSTTSILCGHLRTSSSLVPGVIATAQGAVQAQHLRLQHTPCSSVAAAESLLHSPAHTAQLTTALMAQAGAMSQWTLPLHKVLSSS